MKWRQPVAALVCLFRVSREWRSIYFQHLGHRKPFGIILFVGEGLSARRLGATRIYAAGAGTRLNMDFHAYAGW